MGRKAGGRAGGAGRLVTSSTPHLLPLCLPLPFWPPCPLGGILWQILVDWFHDSFIFVFSPLFSFFSFSSRVDSFPLICPSDRKKKINMIEKKMIITFECDYNTIVIKNDFV